MTASLPQSATARLALSPRVLATLAAIAATGSFARAAERENMTLSAVSMQMKSLESALGAALFDRSFRPPRLTPLGRRVAELAIRILAETDAIVELCRTPGTLSGTFEIGFVLTASVRLLPDFLAAAPDAFPQAQFLIRTGLSHDLAAQVADRTLDAAIVTAGEHELFEPSLTVTTITSEPLVFCLPEAMQTMETEDCLEMMIFVHFTPDTGIGRLIAAYLTQNNLTPQRVVVLDTVEAVAECVRAGVGCAILPQPDVLRYGADGGGIVLRPLAPLSEAGRGKAANGRTKSPGLVRRLVLLTRVGSPVDGVRQELTAVINRGRSRQHRVGSD